MMPLSVFLLCYLRLSLLVLCHFVPFHGVCISIISSMMLHDPPARRISEFHISEAEPSDSYSPVSSFKARGKTFYVDVDNFADKELLERLTPLSEDDKALKAAAEQMQRQKELEEAEASSAGDRNR